MIKTIMMLRHNLFSFGPELPEEKHKRMISVYKSKALFYNSEFYVYRKKTLQEFEKLLLAMKIPKIIISKKSSSNILCSIQRLQSVVDQLSEIFCHTYGPVFCVIYSIQNNCVWLKIQ